MLIALEGLLIHPATVYFTVELLLVVVAMYRCSMVIVTSYDAGDRFEQHLYSIFFTISALFQGTGTLVYTVLFD